MPFGRPGSDVPSIPDNITDVSDALLMETFSRFVQWLNYAATQFAEAEVVEERVTAHLKYIEATAMLTLNPAQGKVTVAKAEMTASQEVERAKQEVLNAYAVRKMTGVMVENCERSASLISRELTRRVGREPLERRQQRWNP